MHFDIDLGYRQRFIQINGQYEMRFCSICTAQYDGQASTVEHDINITMHHNAASPEYYINVAIIYVGVRWRALD